MHIFYRQRAAPPVLNCLEAAKIYASRENETSRGGVMRVAAWAWGVYGARAGRRWAGVAVVVAVVVPVVASLVTYTFVSLPGDAIALDQTGSLVAMLVLLKIFVLGITHHLPFDLNRLWKKHVRVERELQGLPYLLQEVGEPVLLCGEGCVGVVSVSGQSSSLCFS